MFVNRFLEFNLIFTAQLLSCAEVEFPV